MEAVIKKNVILKYEKMDNGQLHWITISLRLIFNYLLRSSVSLLLSPDRCLLALMML